MPIARYGVLRGRPAKILDATDQSPHYQVLVDAGGDKHRIAVNVQSQTAPSEVLYYADDDFRHDLLERILEVEVGFTDVPSEAGGLALDFVRGRLFDTARMRPLPATARRPDNDLNEALDAVVQRALRDPTAELFAFGQGFPPENAKPERDTYFKFSPEQGIHDIHMNQGNDGARFAKDDGTYQDGALFVYFPSAARWSAIFLAFQSQSFQTDEDGHAVGSTSATRTRRRRSRKQPMASLGEGLAPAHVDRASLHLALENRRAPVEPPPPTLRPLRVYAFDPSRGRALGNEMRVDLRYERLARGPIVQGDGQDAIGVVDYDAATKTYYRPVDLDDPSVLIRSGLDPSESNPLFHQQMVYAVATETIQHFEAALGRRLHWRRAEREPHEAAGWHPDDIRRLNFYPHAMRAANAFYCPEAHGVLFGYFRADEREPGRNLPGQPIFTCLSHDIVVHETTHAILDGLRGFFLEQTNPDVAAFHEGFADLAALFRHFTHREVLIDTLQRTGGQLFRYELRPDVPSPEKDQTLASQTGEQNPLIALAQQFGEASGMRRSLRSALGTRPNSDDIRKLTEPHARGSILVSAVFDAFFTVYLKRTADLFRIWRAGGGMVADQDLPGPLANLLCEQATRTADFFFRMCARAIDYCPPMDITFGDFLRAAMTAHADVDPADDEGIRSAWMDAFRVRGIVPDGARFFSDEAMHWPSGRELGLPDLEGLELGNPNCFTPAQRRAILPVLQQYVEHPVVKARLGFDRDRPVSLPSFHPVFTVLRDGRLRVDVIVEAVQTLDTTVHRGSTSKTVPFRGGATLILSHDGARAGQARVRYVVCKQLRRGGGDERKARQRAFLESLETLEGDGAHALRVNFALVHGGM